MHELSLARFNHPAKILPAFRVYSANYRPNKLGQALSIFIDRAKFDDYLNLGIDALGMASEVGTIERLLCDRGVVAGVDGTNYHSELEREDSRRTTEVWGDYVRPSERVIRALATRLMEGDLAAKLRHASLMGIAKPEKVEVVMAKMIRKFYGIDIDVNHGRSTINSVLADLTLHDSRTVLVVDATSITDMERYREFLSLLERHQLKIILRTREPLPGIPQVNIQPFLEDSAPDRIMQDDSRLRSIL